MKCPWCRQEIPINDFPNHFRFKHKDEEQGRLHLLLDAKDIYFEWTFQYGKAWGTISDIVSLHPENKLGELLSVRIADETAPHDPFRVLYQYTSGPRHERFLQRQSHPRTRIFRRRLIIDSKKGQLTLVSSLWDF